jgi:hypothetical protein
MPSNASLAAALVEADAQVAGFLDGTGPEMTADELQAAHQLIAAAVAAGVSKADLNR